MRFRVFISSVQDEFREERRELKQWILQNPLLSRYVEGVFLFEDSPARGDGSQEVFLEEVARSQIYIGILGQRYCGRDHGDCEVSPTELEYDKAGECGLERFVYLLDCAERDERQTAFVRKVNADVKRRSLGSGVRRMVNSCRKANVPNPVFEQAGPSFRVTFWFDQWTPQKMDALSLNGRQRKAVQFLKENPRMAVSDYIDLIDCARRTAQRDLEDLVGKGVFIAKGSTKSVLYELNFDCATIAPYAPQSRQDCAMENSTGAKVAKSTSDHAIGEDKIEKKLVPIGEKLVDDEKKLVFDGEKLVLNGEKLVLDGFSRPSLKRMADVYGRVANKQFSLNYLIKEIGIPESSAIRFMDKLKKARLIVPAEGRGKYMFAADLFGELSK